ncbi:hypothetical protein KDD17_12850 [Sulfitobacter albidus]|uniref:Uncharacterized protein n=1 Tax=Sulfitobacter albidus TaxID=2829501 RepID=A0A975JC84_9RHOB|nr:hypothetical protein [Sulfitobacter albidus]QUJ75824.1 hypothetical protein KDD17_12850 [Sulfitobacter albidus]
MINIYAQSFMTATRTRHPRREELPGPLVGTRSRWFSLRPQVTVDLDKL